MSNDTPQDWINRANRAVEDKNAAALRTNILVAGVGVVWILNAVDAFILGNKKSKEIKRLYFTYEKASRNSDLTLYAGLQREF